MKAKGAPSGHELPTRRPRIPQGGKQIMKECKHNVKAAYGTEEFQQEEQEPAPFEGVQNDRAVGPLSGSVNFTMPPVHKHF